MSTKDENKDAKPRNYLPKPNRSWYEDLETSEELAYYKNAMESDDTERPFERE